MRVVLKASRRPTMSEATPQNEAPMQRPKKRAQVVKRTCDSETPNSCWRGGNVRATPYTLLALVHVMSTKTIDESHLEPEAEIKEVS